MGFKAWLQRYKWVLVLGIIFLVALMLRLSTFSSVPVSLYWDEMAIWNDALSVRDTGLDMHARSWFQPLFISYGDYKLPVYIWFVTVLAFFTDNLMVAVRVPSLLAGVSMVPAVYLFFTGLDTKKNSQHILLGLLVASILAVLPWSVHFSQVGFEGHLSAVFLTWSMTALVWSRRATKTTYRFGVLSLVIFLGTLSVYTYFSTRFVWPILYGVGLVLWWKSFRDWWWVYIVGGIIWVLTLLPMFQADFYNASNQLRLSTENIFTSKETQPEYINGLRLQSGNTIISRALYNRPTQITLALAKNMAQHLSPEYLFFAGDQHLRHGLPDTGLLYPVLAPFLVIGMLAVWRSHWRLAIWLSIWWLVSLVPASVPTDTPHALRSLNALLPVVGFTGLGTMAVWNWVKSQSRGSIYRYGFIFVFGILMFQVLQYQLSRQIAYPTQSAHDWQVGYLPLARFISEERHTFNMVVVDNFDDRFFLYYQPYSGLSWSDIQNIQSQDFARQNLDNVKIVDWEKVELFSDNTLVIIRTEDIATIPEEWQQYSMIKNELGEDAFVAFTTPIQ